MGFPAHKKGILKRPCKSCSIYSVLRWCSTASELTQTCNQMHASPWQTHLKPLFLWSVNQSFFLTKGSIQRNKKEWQQKEKEKKWSLVSLSLSLSLSVCEFLLVSFSTLFFPFLSFFPTTRLKSLSGNPLHFFNTNKFLFHFHFFFKFNMTCQSHTPISCAYY